MTEPNWTYAYHSDTAEVAGNAFDEVIRQIDAQERAGAKVSRTTIKRERLGDNVPQHGRGDDALGKEDSENRTPSAQGKKRPSVAPSRHLNEAHKSRLQPAEPTTSKAASEQGGA